MKVFFEDIRISTKFRMELVDITGSIEDVVQKNAIGNGLCVIHSLHSTTAVIVNEHEAGLMKDIVRKVQEDFQKGDGWLHDKVDDNADAHLASSFIGPTRIFPIRDGKLIRGTWQNIFLLELDGPRNRRVTVQVMGV
jgi:secondary thiamine-phosphate synthase enzyme